jgi:hypothetical protein
VTRKAKVPEARATQPSLPVAAIRGFFHVCGVVVERFGWPGFILFFAAYFVEKHATIEQQRRIIDMYILGEGVNSRWPLLALPILFLLVLWAQQHIHSRKVRQLEDELRTVGIEKSRFQELAAGKPLSHGEDFQTKED